jgi:GR25 family glycosyltransferase involved in LPS biosynthesis
MITPWPGRRLLAVFGVLAVLGAFITFSNLHSSWPSRHDFNFPPRTSTSSGSGLDAIRNETLGFEKILVLNLQERSDKRDALALSASFTGIDLTYIDTIKGAQVVEAARPFDHEANELYQNTWGSWRGHMNAARTILEQRLASALVLEDDIDWDVNLKTQLQNFAHASRWLTSTRAFPNNKSYINTTSSLDASTGHISLTPEIDITTPPHEPRSTPYGSNWDILWLGHCGEGLRPDDARLFIILNDITVPPLSSFTNKWGRGFDPAAYGPPHTRFVYASNLPVCTFAYAVSRSGAQKLLYYASVSGLLTNTFDVALGEMCRHKTLSLECLSVNPSLFMNFQKKGPTQFDSDTDPGKENGKNRTVDKVDNLVFSTRLNAERLIGGMEAVGQDWDKLQRGGGDEDRLGGNPYDTGSPLSKEVLDGFH